MVEMRLSPRIRSATTALPVKGLPMAIDFGPVISSVSATIGLAKVALEARDDAKIRQAISDMQRLLADANGALLTVTNDAFQLQIRANELEAECLRLQQRLDERARYVLREVRPGAFVYAFDPVGDDKTPAHYICQPCSDKGKKVVLRGDVDGDALRCAEDRLHYLVLRERNADPIDYPKSFWET
jgi:hypothetical protein